MSSDFAALTDEQLAFALRRLELRLAALRYAASAAGQALYREFRDRRDAAIAEQERRRV